VKFRLTKPIGVEGAVVHELEIREEVTAGDLMAADEAKGEVGKSIHIIAALANVPPSSIKAMSAGDFARLNKLIEPFLSGGPNNGGTSAAKSPPSSGSGPTTSAG